MRVSDKKKNGWGFTGNSKIRPLLIICFLKDSYCLAGKNGHTSILGEVFFSPTSHVLKKMPWRPCYLCTSRSLERQVHPEVLEFPGQPRTAKRRLSLCGFSPLMMPKGQFHLNGKNHHGRNPKEMEVQIPNFFPQPNLVPGWIHGPCWTIPGMLEVEFKSVWWFISFPHGCAWVPKRCFETKPTSKSKIPWPRLYTHYIWDSLISHCYLKGPEVFKTKMARKWRKTKTSRLPEKFKTIPHLVASWLDGCMT